MHINICSRYLGFGTCCTVVLEEGGSSSLNQTYMVQASTTSLTTGPMTYTICPCSSDVCRIRFDFTVSNIIAIEIWIYPNFAPQFEPLDILSFYSNLCWLPHMHLLLAPVLELMVLKVICVFHQLLNLAEVILMVTASLPYNIIF